MIRAHHGSQGMKNNMSQLKNVDCPFTELFALLKTETTMVSSDFVHNSKTLTSIYQHAENAIDMMLQGLQDIGQLIGILGKNINFTEFFNIGFFISGISNLAEALHSLKQDVDFLLKMRM